MDFTNLKIKIKGSTDVELKAYLEDSDIIYNPKSHQLQLTPTSYTNDHMAIRVEEKAKFTFNVFSEDIIECKSNYKNLQSLITMIKPIYSKQTAQLIPDRVNTTGLLSIEFQGLPVKNRKSIQLHLTSFVYEINKELGYIQIPKSELGHSGPGLKLVPLAYKLSIEGNVLLEFEKTTRTTTEYKYSGEAGSVLRKNEVIKAIDNWIKQNSDPSIANKTYATLTREQQNVIYAKFNQAKNIGYVGADGNFVENSNNKKYTDGLQGFASDLVEMLVRPPFTERSSK